MSSSDGCVATFQESASDCRRENSESPDRSESPRSCLIAYFKIIRATEVFFDRLSSIKTRAPGRAVMGKVWLLLVAVKHRGSGPLTRCDKPLRPLAKAKRWVNVKDAI